MIARSLLEQSAAQDIKVFYSYAHRNEEWLKEFSRTVGEFKCDIDVRTWCDSEIAPGSEWGKEIDDNLAAADLVLLFIGQAFVESDYCTNTELPIALARHERGEARVIPVIMEETNPDWRELGLGHIQALPTNAVPVASWKDRREGLVAVAQGLVDLVVQQGLHHASRIRWEIQLKGEAVAFEGTDRSVATEELRTYCRCPTLRVVKVEPGSITLTIESTQDAFALMTQLVDTGQATTLAGRNVVGTRQLFGAGVRAFSTITGMPLSETLPDPDLMLLPSHEYTPCLAIGIQFDAHNPLDCPQLIVDLGDSKIDDTAAAAETRLLLDYFLTVLAVPEEEVYVNLSPGDDVQLLAESLKGTRLGMTLLESDLRLKRLSTSLLHPDLDTGRSFWREVQTQCRKRLGTSDVPLTAFQRVWLCPDECTVIRDDGAMDVGSVSPGQNAAYVMEASLQALTEREFYANQSRRPSSDVVSRICSDVFREIILPCVLEDVNKGETFGPMRQFYNCLVLGLWFKVVFKDHPQVSPFIDTGDVQQLTVKDVSVGSFSNPVESVRNAGTTVSTPQSEAVDTTVQHIRNSPRYQIPENREYFERYLNVFNSGVFHVSREELDSEGVHKRARAYLAGGIDMRGVAAEMFCETLGKQAL